MRTTRIPDEALAVLSSCVVKDYASNQSSVAITAGQLDRKLYQQVDTVLREIGGKWHKTAKLHLFGDPHEVVEGKLDNVIVTGEITLAKKNGYFPTPAPLADLMARRLNLTKDHTVLEPSFGGGSLIIAAIQNGADDIIGVELNEALIIPTKGTIRREYPQAGVMLIHGDFMQPEVLGISATFDRIIMNPPFERFQDIRHVTRAYELLNPGGQLISIMGAGVLFREEKIVRDFRELVAKCGSYIERLPAESFKQSGTLVNTVMVHLKKSRA